MIALYAASVGWMVAASSMPQQMDRHRIDRNRKDEDGQAVRRSGGPGTAKSRPGPIGLLDTPQQDAFSSPNISTHSEAGGGRHPRIAAGDMTLLLMTSQATKSRSYCDSGRNIFGGRQRQDSEN